MRGERKTGGDAPGIDLDEEHALGLAALARRIPPGRSGRPVHPGTVGRWIKQGARGMDGRVVRLEGVRVASRWVTTLEAFRRFIAALTPPAAGPPQHVSGPPTTRRAAVSTGDELRRMGA